MRLAYLIPFLLIFRPALSQIPPHNVKFWSFDQTNGQPLKVLIDLYSRQNEDRFDVHLLVKRTTDRNENSKYESEEHEIIIDLDTVLVGGEHAVTVDYITNTSPGIRYEAILSVRENNYYDYWHLQSPEKDNYWNKVFSWNGLSTLFNAITIPLKDADRSNSIGIYDLEEKAVVKFEVFESIDILTANLSDQQNKIIMAFASPEGSSIGMYDLGTDQLVSLSAGSSPVWLPGSQSQFYFINNRRMMLGNVNNPNTPTPLDIEADRLLRADFYNQRQQVIYQKQNRNLSEINEYYSCTIGLDRTVSQTDMLVPYSFLESLELISPTGSGVLRLENSKVGYEVTTGNGTTKLTELDLPEDLIGAGASWSTTGKFIVFWGNKID